MERCAGCLFVYGELAPADIGGRLRAAAPQYRRLLSARRRVELQRTTSAGVWTPLQYACHVRDVVVTQRERLARALVEDQPDTTPMGGVGRERLAVERRYNDQDPLVVADELDGALTGAADDFDALDEAAWARTCVYHWPVDAVRDMRWLGRHTVHEAHHHLQDAWSVLGPSA